MPATFVFFFQKKLKIKSKTTKTAKKTTLQKMELE